MKNFSFFDQKNDISSNNKSLTQRPHSLSKSKFDVKEKIPLLENSKFPFINLSNNSFVIFKPDILTKSKYSINEKTNEKIYSLNTINDTFNDLLVKFQKKIENLKNFKDHAFFIDFYKQISLIFSFLYSEKRKKVYIAKKEETFSENSTNKLIQLINNMIDIFPESSNEKNIELKSYFIYKNETNINEFIEKIEDFIANISNSLTKIKQDNEILCIENDRLNNIIKKRAILERDEISNLIDKSNLHNEYGSTKLSNSLDFLNKFEKIYQSQVDSLIKTKEELIQIISLSELKITQLQEENIKIKKSNIQPKNLQMKSIEIQTNSPLQFFLLKSDNFLENYLADKETTGFFLSNNLVNAIINMILSYKVIEDYSCFLNGQQITNLSEYLLPFFLKFFENSLFAESLLHDFLINLINNDKTSLFIKLIGLNKNNISPIKQKMEQSILSQKLCVKIAIFRKNLAKKVENDTLSPFFPDSEYSVLECGEAIETATIFLKENGFNEREITNFEKRFFEKLINGNLKYRQKINRTDSSSKKRNSLETNSIKSNIRSSFIDLEEFCDFCLEELEIIFEMKIEEILRLIRIRENNSIISTSDFVMSIEKEFPNLKRNYMEKIFAEFIEKNKGDLKETIIKIAHLFIDENSCNKFYLETENNLNEFETLNYDIYSSLVIIVETYEILRENIKLNEENNDHVAVNNDMLKKELTKMPINFGKNIKFSSFFSGFNRKELYQKVQNCWKILRILIDTCSKSKIK